MIQSRTLNLVLFALLGCLMVGLSLQNKPELSDDWKEDHYKLYSTSKDTSPIDSSSALEILKKLQGLYRGRNDNGSLNRMEKVTKLIEVSHISADKCNKLSMDSLDELIAKHEMYVNLAPYLELHRKRQLDLCLTLTWKLRIFSGQTSASAVMVLSNSIKNADVKSRYYNKKAKNQLAAGILSFIESRTGSLKRSIMEEEGTDVRSKLAALIERTVGGACQPLKAIFELDESSIDESSHGNEFLVNEMLINTWSERFRRCNIILDNMEAVALEAEDSINGVKL